MDRSRVRIAAVVVPALIIGALLGDWAGSRLFFPSEAPADAPAAAAPPRPVEVRITIPATTSPASPSDTGVPPDSSVPGAGPQAPAGPVAGDPGNPANPGNPGGGNQPPPPTVAVTTAPPPSPPPPPPPEWAGQSTVSIQVIGSFPTGATVQLGRAQGWLQMKTNRTAFRYSITFSRQSSYMLPTMAVSVNGAAFTTIIPSYNDGFTATASNEHPYQGTIRSVYLKLSGSTFLGSDHTIFTQNQTFTG